MEKQHNTLLYISAEILILYQKIHALRDAAFGVDCLTFLRILKILIIVLKIDSGNAVKNSNM